MTRLRALLLVALTPAAFAQYALVGEFAPAGLTSGDHFGMSVDASHDWAVYGAIGDGEKGADAGAVHVQSQPDGAFVRKLVAGNGAAGDHLGGSVALDGTRVAAGMHVLGTNTRSVYVFDVATGAQIFELQAPVPVPDDDYGLSVGISDQFVLVGCPGDDEVAVDSGAIYVYDAQTGALLHKNKAPVPQAGDRFGQSVDLDGNIAVVGMPGTFGAIAGEVHLFDLTVNVFLGTIDSPCSCVGGFGQSVAVDAPRIVVHSPGDDTVYVFDLGGVPQLALHPPAPASGFGISVAVYGSRIAVGHIDSFAFGTAYVYDSIDGRLLSEIEPDDLASGDLYGFATAVNVWGVIATSPNHGHAFPNLGAAFQYAYDGCPQDRYCSPANPNSSGSSAIVDIDTCALGGSVLVTATQLPANQFGYLLVGNGSDVVFAPNVDGPLCLGDSTPAIGRYVADVASSGPNGTIVTDIVNGGTGQGSGQLPAVIGGSLAAGQTWNFQLWYRDGPSSNFSDAIRVLFE